MRPNDTNAQLAIQEMGCETPHGAKRSNKGWTGCPKGG